MSKQYYVKQLSTVSMSKTVPFERIHFGISAQFKSKFSLMVKTFLFEAIKLIQTVLIQTIHFCINMQLVLLNSKIGPYQVLPFRARVNLGAMAVKGYFAFHKAPASLEPHHQIV